jgi:hypothetical protein
MTAPEKEKEKRKRKGKEKEKEKSCPRPKPYGGNTSERCCADCSPGNLTARSASLTLGHMNRVLSGDVNTRPIQGYPDKLLC